MQTRFLLACGLFSATLLALSFSAAVHAQTPAVKASPAPAGAIPPAKTPIASAFSEPAWSDLSPAQRTILQPLAQTWPTLSQGHKRKWLEMTKTYPSLSADEQVKMQGRMREWVALSPQQRAQARLNFAKTKELSKELTVEEKKAKWEAYQSLSDEEKRKLAAKAPSKPVGAAPAAKPVARQKLALVPAPGEKKVKTAPKIAVSQSPEAAPGAAHDAAPADTHATPAQPH